MSDHTQIEWTEATWNPLRGCSAVSPGCANCYAARVAARFSGDGQPYEELAAFNGKRAHWTGVVRAASDWVIEQPLRWRRPRLIFVNSMSDLFHERVTDQFIDLIFRVMRKSKQHTFQILTKRAERMAEYIAGVAADGPLRRWGGPIPLPNVWLGVSAEDQTHAVERISFLAQTPASKTFLSAEPLLGPIDLITRINPVWEEKNLWPCSESLLFALDWVIVGGESGPNSRAIHPQWIRNLRDQCRAANVPFFFKQWGSFRECEWKAGQYAIASNRRTVIVDPVGLRFEYRSNWSGRDGSAAMQHVGKRAAGRTIDGREWSEFPV